MAVFNDFFITELEVNLKEKKRAKSFELERELNQKENIQKELPFELISLFNAD